MVRWEEDFSLGYHIFYPGTEATAVTVNNVVANTIRPTRMHHFHSSLLTEIANNTPIAGPSATVALEVPPARGQILTDSRIRTTSLLPAGSANEADDHGSTTGESV